MGQGFYIHWPIFGPSSPRDTVGQIGDTFLHPFTYVFDTDVLIGTKAYERVNSTSLAIGDYESLKDAAVDPYVAIRDACVQYQYRYRLRNVISEGGKPAPSGTGGGSYGSFSGGTSMKTSRRRAVPRWAFEQAP